MAQPAPDGAGVVVLHDWFGLHPHVELLCEDLSRMGFAAAAPDIYGMTPTLDAGEAEQRMMSTPDERFALLLGEAVGELREGTGGGPVGAVGFSMGGVAALRLADDLGLAAVVAFYAALAPDEVRRVSCPVQLHLAEHDDWDPPDTPDRFVEEVRAQGGMVEVHTYPGTSHSFANPEAGGVHDPSAAEESWARTLSFLERHLVPGNTPASRHVP